MNKMNSTLYIYDGKNLNGLKSTLNEYKFFSIAYLFHMCDTLPELSDIIAGAFDKTVIDITNLITDGNYYRIFSERYLYILSENIPDLHFCMNYKVFDKFTERFPYFFEEANTNWDFHDFEGVEEQVEPFATSNLNSNSIIAIISIISKRFFSNSAMYSFRIPIHKSTKDKMLLISRDPITIRTILICFANVAPSIYMPSGNSSQYCLISNFLNISYIEISTKKTKNAKEMVE